MPRCKNPKTAKLHCNLYTLKVHLFGASVDYAVRFAHRMRIYGFLAMIKN